MIEHPASQGILVRHFTKARIKDYNRITVGSREQMEELVPNTSEANRKKNRRAEVEVL